MHKTFIYNLKWGNVLVKSVGEELKMLGDRR